jgi:hypothetical protein
MGAIYVEISMFCFSSDFLFKICQNINKPLIEKKFLGSEVSSMIEEEMF